MKIRISYTFDFDDREIRQTFEPEIKWIPTLESFSKWIPITAEPIERKIEISTDIIDNFHLLNSERGDK